MALMKMAKSKRRYAVKEKPGFSCSAPEGGHQGEKCYV